MGQTLTVDRARRVRTARNVAARGGLGPRRPAHDPFDPGLETAPGSRPTAESAAIARRMLVPLADDHAGTDRYLESFSSVPADHTHRLEQRAVKIVIAANFSGAVRSDWANLRRNRPATPKERADAADHDASNVVAIFEPELNSIVCPLDPLDRLGNQALDCELVALHEIGHALTLRLAWSAAPTRTDLLRELTPAIAHHLKRYRQGNAPDAIRERVTEALAESYRLLMSGRADEVSPALMSALLDILEGNVLSVRANRA